MADFNKAIELKPDLAAAYNNRGLVRAKSDLDGALVDFNGRLSLNPVRLQAFSIAVW